MVTETIGFRPNAADKRILSASGDSPTATIRRALRLLDHERWLEQARQDAWNARDENLNAELDRW